MSNKQRPLSIPEWTLGDRLAKARRHAQVNQAKMAAELGVSHSAVSYWESGSRKPALPIVARWAELCHVPTAWLIDGDRARG